VETGRGRGRGGKKNSPFDGAAAALIAESLAVADGVEAGRCGPAEAEGRIRAAAPGFAAEVVGAVLSGPAQRAAGVDAPPGRRGRRETKILPGVGEVSYSRAYVRGPDGRPGFPADRALGITRGCTPAAAKLLCHEAARSQSYLQASENLALACGLAVSPGTIHRLVAAVGPDMEAWALERPPARVEDGREIIVCLEMDMTGVRMLKKYLKGVKGKDGAPKCRQIKCGTLFLMERDGEGRYRRLPDTAVHLVSFCDPASFSASLEEARRKLGVRPGTALVVVSDGAEWIWNIVSDRFKEAAGVVDFWHAADHLHELCEFAEGKGAAAEALFKEWRRKLKSCGVDCVIRHFAALDLKKAKTEGVHKRLRYFRGHRGRMQYRRFRREGWPIGSGVIEGACKSLIKQRTDLSGQRWSPDGALNILWARALITDGLHDAYWTGVRDREATVRAAVTAA
jgi:hypothetical protein